MRASIFLFIYSFTSAVFAISTELPDAALTPGDTDPKVTQSSIKSTICKDKYTMGVRHVTESHKKSVLKAYADKHKDWPKCNFVRGKPTCEIDHLVSLELGGTNDAKNLWPQPYCPEKTAGKHCFGAREKDVVETHLKDMVCSGKITLKEAQNIIKSGWRNCYQSLKGLLIMNGEGCNPRVVVIKHKGTQ